MDIANAIGDVVSNGYRNMVHREGDKVGDDGLLHCGVCGERKERFITLFNGKEIKVPVLCVCDEKQRAIDARIAEEEERKNRMIRLRSKSMMDVKYHDADFDNFLVNSDNEKILALCKKYVSDFREFYGENQGLLFYGDVGTGKSYCAACIANELIKNGTSVLMTSFARILEIIRKGSDEENEMLRQIMDTSLVIFDDFGAERNTEYALEKVFDVLDTRYRSKKPMIITTNLKFKEMVAEDDIRYKRLYDRIFEVCYPVEFKGDSWRKVEATARFAKMREILRDS